MVRKLKIYLETTMFSFYYEERQHEEYQNYKAQVRQVFDLIKAGKLEPHTSPYTYQELANIKHEIQRENRLNLIPQYGVKIIQHIARPWTIAKVSEINSREGYRAIGIYKPAEVL